MQHAQSIDFAPNNERHIDTFYYVTDSRLLFPRQQISSECVDLARSFVATWVVYFRELLVPGSFYSDYPDVG